MPNDDFIEQILSKTNPEQAGRKVTSLTGVVYPTTAGLQVGGVDEACEERPLQRSFAEFGSA